MLNAIINWSLHNRLAVLAIAVVFAGLGMWSVPELPIDAYLDRGFLNWLKTSGDD